MPPPALYPGPVPRLLQLPTWAGEPGSHPASALPLGLGPRLLALKLSVLLGSGLGLRTHFLGPVACGLCGTSEEAEGRECEPRQAETSPEVGSAFSLQAGSPRLAAQVQRRPSTTTYCSCRAAAVSPQAGERTPTLHPLAGIYALATWSRPGPLLCPGASPGS